MKSAIMTTLPSSNLEKRVDHLTNQVDWWNGAMVWALLFTALAAIAVVVTTRMVLIRSKELSKAQEDLLGDKERQLSLDLKEKDLKVADATHSAVAA